MEIKTVDTNAKFSIDEALFECEYNEGLVHQAVVTYMNNARSGNSAQKTRSEVRGGGKKPWNQKGTGRARAGTIRSPLWRSGGVTFAAKKRDYSQKINKKMYKGAIRSIISELYRTERISFVSDFQCSSMKTKDFFTKMKDFGFNDALVVMEDVGENEYLGSRNLYQYDVCDVAALDPVILLTHKNIIMTEAAVKRLEEQYK